MRDRRGRSAGPPSHAVDVASVGRAAPRDLPAPRVGARGWPYPARPPARARAWRPFGVPPVVASRPRCRLAPARCPINARSGCLGPTYETLVMMGSGVRVPRRLSGKPHEQGHSGRRGLHWHRCSRRCGVPCVPPSPTAGLRTTHDQRGAGSISARAAIAGRTCKANPQLRTKGLPRVKNEEPTDPDAESEP